MNDLHAAGLLTAHDKPSDQRVAEHRQVRPVHVGESIGTEYRLPHSIMDLRVRDGMRQSVFRSYAFPYMDRPNLPVLCHALVTRLVMSGKQASGVEIVHAGPVQRLPPGVGGVLSFRPLPPPRPLTPFRTRAHTVLPPIAQSVP